MTDCEICGQEYGKCNVDVHLEALHRRPHGEEYTLDIGAETTTPFYAHSVSPRLREPHLDPKYGGLVTEVTPVKFIG